GTAGTVLSEILFFGEPVDWLKIFFILLIIIGVIGLKAVTEEKMPERNES
ncbi:MAG: QacE family quaternary ammonium compound efflux SMR transporter, partial [Bacillales bacterium]